MKTRDQMIAAIRRFVNDVSAQYMDSDEIVLYMEQACVAITTDLLADSRSRRFLRRVSPGVPLVADQVEYARPVDARQIECVEFRLKDSDDIKNAISNTLLEKYNILNRILGVCAGILNYYGKQDTWKDSEPLAQMLNSFP